MPDYIDNCRVTISNSPGTSGALTVNAPVDATYAGFAAGNNGRPFHITAVEPGVGTETFESVYTHSGTSLSRGTRLSSTSGARINLTSAAVVTVVLAEQTATNLDRLALRATIEGFLPTWVSATQVGASAGSALIESTGLICRATSAPANITPSVSANTWYHVYLYLSGTTPTLESSTTAPVAFAVSTSTARSKSGDTSRRYLYSFKTNAAASIINFVSDGSRITYRAIDLSAAPFRLLSAGSATTKTTVSLSSAIPVTAYAADILGQQTVAGGIAVALCDNSYSPSTTAYEYLMFNGVLYLVSLACDSSQNVAYANSAGGGSAYIDVRGYLFSR